MNAKPLISVIIPVYKSLPWLRDCVDSVLNRTYENLEVILVNDGSPDGCPAICDDCAARDPRVRVIHRENAGVSAARNAGLRAAAGDYILFVDADDLLAADAMAGFAEALTRTPAPDLVFLDMAKLYPDGRRVPLGEGFERSRIAGRDRRTVLAHLAGLPKFPGSPCAKLIRRDLFTEKNLSFSTRYTYAEDIDLCVGLFAEAAVFDYIPGDFYLYRQGHKPTPLPRGVLRQAGDFLSVIEAWAERTEAKNKTEQERYMSVAPEIHAFLACELVIAIGLSGLVAGAPDIERAEKEALFGRVRRLLWLLKEGRSRRARLTRVLCAVLGSRGAASLLAAYIRRSEKR